MSTPIILNPQDEALVQAQVQSGLFATAADVIHAALSQWQPPDPATDEENAALFALLEEGLNSGVSDKTIEQIFDDVVARMRADGEL